MNTDRIANALRNIPPPVTPQDRAAASGRNAAEWAFQYIGGGRVVHNADWACRRTIDMIDDGDPEFETPPITPDMWEDWADGSPSDVALISDLVCVYCDAYESELYRLCEEAIR